MPAPCCAALFACQCAPRTNVSSLHGPGADDPLVWYEVTSGGTGARRYLHKDERGSVIATTNASGGINSYDDYGIPASTNIGRFPYTGQQWLSDLGLYHYKARIYSPTLGRFLQTDPIGYGAGMNMYAYVNGDPITPVDSDGREPTNGISMYKILTTLDSIDREARHLWREVATKLYSTFGHEHEIVRSRASRFNPDVVFLPSCKVCKLILHSHFSRRNNAASELFSDQENSGSRSNDINTSESAGVPIWLITPQRSVKVYDPANNSISILARAGDGSPFRLPLSATLVSAKVKNGTVRLTFQSRNGGTFSRKATLQSNKECSKSKNGGYVCKK